ncbi:MAG: FKBP-type peptidyl-prolyl cis-trans isomerase [Flavobacteriales bacterium]|jgi:FKBP-type peptidyl-prolyl cis-trans isomerase|nr:FKBP-type peptidyl-prolyl cis-trans isomerase [Flavobacteriales bacterium]
MRLALVFLIISLFLVGCNDSEHFSYTRHSKSVHYKLIALGDESRPVNQAHHLTMNLTFISSGDTMAFKQFKRIDKSGSRLPEYLGEILQTANQGDSISIIGLANELMVGALIGVDTVFNKEQEYQIELMVEEALSDAQLRTVLAEERLKKDLELKELGEMKAMVDSLNLNENNQYKDMYIKFLDDAGGEFVKQGDRVSVHYRAALANGNTIDDNFEMDPFEYEVGKPDQVIDGFSIGMERLTIGSEALFIIPPHLAFGSKGSSSGIVPPGSTIVYHVKLLGLAD